MIKDAPDSGVEESTVEVFSTPERDGPKFGAVSIRLGHKDSNHTTVLKLSRRDSALLADLLKEHLKQ